jgi:hypothetical protein
LFGGLFGGRYGDAIRARLEDAGLEEGVCSVDIQSIKDNFGISKSNP